MNSLQLIIFHLETKVEHYEKMKEQFINDNCKPSVHHVGGIIEGLKIAINSTRSINSIK